MPAETPEIKVPPPTKAAIGYLAGIMDGEGYFQGSPKTNSFGLRVAMTDECVIDYLATTFAGWRCRQGVTSAGNPIYTWALQRKADLRFLLPLLIPHLVCKRRQAEAMLTLIAHLDAHPAKGYDRPTKSTSGAERARRTHNVNEWRAQREVLRARIAAAR